MGTALASARAGLDLEPLLVDMQRRVRFTALPKEPFVVRFEVRGHHQRFMLLKKTEASLCHQNPGFPEPVCVRGPLAALVAWWRGDMSFVAAQRMGLAIDGPKAFTRAFCARRLVRCLVSRPRAQRGADGTGQGGGDRH